MAIPPYIPPIPRASGGTGTIQAGAAPTPPPKAPHPGEEVLMQGSMSRFGGRLLRRKDALGLGIITFAVENAGNGPYLTESLRLYRRLNRLELPLIRLSESSPLGRYTLFDFEIHPEELSLRECLQSESGQDVQPETVLKALISLLDRLQQTTDAACLPLSCLSLDTVFLNPKTGAVRVLPLRGLPGHYPATSAPESGTPRAELRTDLFDAVMVYRQLLSRDPGMPLSLKSTNLTLHNCTQYDPADRPDFLEVRNVVLRESHREIQPAPKAAPSLGETLSRAIKTCVQWFYRLLNLRKPGESDRESTDTYSPELYGNGG